MANYTDNYNLKKPEYTDLADIGDINGNMDIIDGAMNGMKTKQTAKSDPTASGTAKQFIDSITQNTNGVITATKKTVSTMTGATSSSAGATGLVPAPATGNRSQFLKGDGTWATPTDTTYSTATSDTAGLIKIGYSESGNNYAVKLSSGKAYVTVPTVDTKNTAGSTNTTSKLFIIGATSQAANPQTYSRSTAYVGTDGHLYSNGSKVLNTGTAVTIAQGGTGATTASAARSNLGLGAAATQAVANNVTTSSSGSVLDARQGKTLKTAIDGKVEIDGTARNLVIKTASNLSTGRSATQQPFSGGAFPNACIAVYCDNPLVHIIIVNKSTYQVSADIETGTAKYNYTAFGY